VVVAFQCPGDPEVRHEGGAVAREEDVLRLDVPMDDAVLVGVVQRAGGLPADLEGHIHGKLPLAANPVAEALALDEGHGEPQPAGDLARVQHGEDVRVLQPGGEADLALESLRPQRRGQLGVEHLERHRPVVPKVLGQVNDGHAPAAELALDLVAIPQSRAEVHQGIRHEVPPSTSCRNRGCFRSGSKVGSIRSQPGER